LPGFGSRVELRKASWAERATSGGLLPVRLWWVSTGTAPCYGHHPVSIRLSGGGMSRDIPLTEDVGRFMEGDDTTNRMLWLPELAGTNGRRCDPYGHMVVPPSFFMQ